MTRKVTFGAAVAACLLLSVALGAQKPVTRGASVSETFTVEAIDYTGRLVTLKDAQGESETVYCGPEVERFDALKVGDKVTFRYYESMVLAIRKPGSGPTPAGSSGIVRAPDQLAGTISQQKTAVVTITAIDTTVPSVSITTTDGQKLSVKVENPKNLEGVKVGDEVEITYTQALAISVAQPGK